MASEFIKAVLEAEEECKKQESEARKKAEEKKQKAKTDAENMTNDARKQVEKMLADDNTAVSASIAQRLAKERKKVQEECKQLSLKAEKNLQRVTDTVIKALVNQ